MPADQTNPDKILERTLASQRQVIAALPELTSCEKINLRITDAVHEAMTEETHYHHVTLFSCCWEDADTQAIKDCKTIQKLIKDTLKGDILDIMTISRARPKLIVEDASIALSQHVRKAEENSLFIFHYAGHGVHSGSSTGLELKASCSTGHRAAPASLPLTAITRVLERDKVDFLFIVDCCEAGAYMRSSISTRRDFMFACQQEETTNGGDYSFTSVIDQHWRHLWDSRDFFLVREITDAIRAERFQINPQQGPVTKSLGREICIGPPNTSKREKTVSAWVIAAFHVDVDSCGNEKIATLAASLARNVGVRVLCALPAQSAVVLIQMPLHVYSHLSQFCEMGLISVSLESTMATFSSSMLGR